MRDYEDLVKSLRYCAEYDCTTVCPRAGTGNGCITRLKKEAADAIEVLSRENRSLADTVNKADEIIRNRGGKWISTKDRLPECEPGTEVGNITFRLQSGTIESGCFGRGGLQRDEYFRTWTDPCEGWGVESVTHWIKLPDAEVKGQ